MFKCDKCGKCCRNLKLNEIYSFLDRGDGVCKYLDLKKNLCEIYDNRPILCNVDKMYDYYRKKYTKEDFYRLNTLICKKLKEEL